MDQSEDENSRAQNYGPQVAERPRRSVSSRKRKTWPGQLVGDHIFEGETIDPEINQMQANSDDEILEDGYGWVASNPGDATIDDLKRRNLDA